MKTFKDTNLNYSLIKAIEEIGFISPTIIQQKSISHILNSNRDLIALAQTGTGKTAAFGLPLIHKIISSSYDIPTILIICPTRELSIQITKDFFRFSKYLSNIKIVSIYGGTNIDNQIKTIQHGINIVIGTPGRIIDLIKRGHLKLNKIRYLVLDEADEMLNMGFKEDLDIIIQQLPINRQSLLFSATMSNNMMKVANSYLKNPIEIKIGKVNIGSEFITHYFYHIINHKNRYLALKRIVDITPNIYAIIFCATIKETKELTKSLIYDGYNADALYGDLSQKERESVMTRFRNKKLQILIATDVASRGIDINNITHVINYTLPESNEIYLHRSGRTGRAGNQGIAISIIHIKEIYKIKKIEKIIDQKIKKLILPTVQEICKQQLLQKIDKFEQVILDNNKEINSYLSIILKKLDKFNKEEIIQRFLLLEINKFLKYYKDDQDIQNIQDNNLYNTKQKSTNKNLSKMYLNLGINNNINKFKLIQLIKKASNKKNILINSIKIYKKYSYFEIQSIYKNKILHVMNKMNYAGNLINIKHLDK